MRKSAAAPALLFGLLWGGGCLLAQVPAKGLPPSPNQFDFYLAAGERWTSNPEFKPESESFEGDYISDLRANVSMLRKTERTDWSLQYTPFYTRYRETTRLNTYNHAFDYDGHYSVSRRFRVILAERFSYIRDPLHLVAVGEASPILTEEAFKRWWSQADAGVETDLSRSLTLDTGVASRVNRFEDPALTDSNTWAAHAGLLKQLGRNQTLTATYTYALFLLSGDVSDFSSHTLEVGWGHAAPGRAEVHVSGGASEVLRGGEQQTWFSGSASYRQPFRRMDLTADFRQGLSADTGVASVNVYQNLTAGLSARIGRITTLGVTGDYGTRKSALTGETTVDLSYAGAVLRGGVAVNDWMTVAAEASRRKQRDAIGTAGDVMVRGYYAGMIFKVF